MKKDVNWERLNARYYEIMGGGPLQPGRMYRAVTLDGDICDGLLTLHLGNRVELQTGSCFRSFNMQNTKLILIESTEIT